MEKPQWNPNWEPVAMFNDQASWTARRAVFDRLVGRMTQKNCCEKILQVQKLWRRRLYDMERTGLPVSPRMRLAMVCPPVGVYYRGARPRCNIPICPFCFGASVVRLFFAMRRVWENSTNMRVFHGSLSLGSTDGSNVIELYGPAPTVQFDKIAKETYKPLRRKFRRLVAADVPAAANRFTVVLRRVNGFAERQAHVVTRFSYMMLAPADWQPPLEFPARQIPQSDFQIAFGVVNMSRYPKSWLTDAMSPHAAAILAIIYRSIPRRVQRYGELLR